jgi:hypothetical protein
MKRSIEGEDRSQSTLFPEHLDDYIEDNPVQVIDVFVDELDLRELGAEGYKSDAEHIGDWWDVTELSRSGRYKLRCFA